MHNLNTELNSLATTWGADFYGIADLNAAHDFIAEQGGSEIAAYPRAISVGIALLHPIVDALPQRAQRQVAITYRQHAYDVINQRLDLLISRLGSALQCKGYNALPIAASKRMDNERICSAFSHKLAAHLAGLGWIGKSCLLVTPQNGPRVRWATVLTNAMLPVHAGPMASRCGVCTECVDNCPAHAFSGRTFMASEPRSERYDAAKCDRHFAALRKTDPEMAVCGMCLYICPHGRSASARLHNSVTLKKPNP